MPASFRALGLLSSILGITLVAACGDDTGSGGSGGSTSSSSSSGGPSSSSSGSPSSSSTSTSSSSATSSSSSGMGGEGGMAIADELLYHGDFATDGVHQIGFSAYPGPMTTIYTLMGLGANDITSVAYSPDSTQIAVAGRDTAGSPMVINIYAADGSGAPLTLVTASAADRVIDDLQWSPDGSMIAFLYDDETAGSFGLYAVPSDGATTEILVSQAPGADADVTSFEWSPDTSGNERYLAYTGDFTENGEFSLWSVDAAATVPAPVGLVTDADLDTGEDVQATLAFDDQGRLYFKSDFEVDDLFRLYRVDIDGQNRVQVPGTDLMNTGGTVEASIGSFGISAAGDRIAFSSDSPTANLYEMYIVDVGADTAVKVSNVTPATPAGGDSSGPDFGSPIWWSPDGNAIAAKADYVLVNGENDDTFSLWLFPTTGVGGTRVVGAPTSTNLHVEEAVFSADSARIYARGDLRVNGDNEIYQITDFSTSDQDPTTHLHQGVVTGGDIVGFAVP